MATAWDEHITQEVAKRPYLLGKPKPPVKRAAAVPQQAPLPRPKPQAKGDAALPPSPAMEMAPPPPPAPESKPADSVPN